jgi:hypothetical protein
MVIGMKRYLIIEDGVVVNAVIANEKLASNWIESEIGGVGWLWDGVTLSQPLPTPLPVPESITPRQARLKLLEVGLLDELEAVITTNRAWQIEWEYATEVKRDSLLIDAIATQAGLTDEQIDQMFIDASTL